MKGKLFLIPTPLASETQDVILPQQAKDAIRITNHFLCESIRSARRFIGALKIHDSVESLSFVVLDKETKKTTLPELMAPLWEGKNMGVVSESGCPGIADPGAEAVRFAHEHKITVVPLSGPSSIFLALMASGLNGQKFAFHGYLPIQSAEAFRAIKILEQESREKNQTQIFIETPYRNNVLLGHLLKTLRPDTQLCVACALTSDKENIICREVNLWKKYPIKFEKVPAVFLFLATR